MTAASFPFTARVWPSTATLLLCFVGVLLPNALFLAALALGIGTPPRTAAILAYATLAILARRLPPWATALLLVVIAAYDAIATLALLFNLAATEIGMALRFGAELKFFESPLYVALAAGSALLLVVTFLALTGLRRRMGDGNVLLVALVAVVFAALDFFVNTSPHYHYGTYYAAGRPMESAAESSGFRAAALSGNGRHLIVVMVEALGEFSDPALRSRLLEPFRAPGVLERYFVTSGATTYFGSTTAAEMRELCNTREPYQALVEGHGLDCLPAQLAARGYRTIGVHNFTGNFFDRTAWYPLLGFGERIFGEDLVKLLQRRCGGPFRGPCDVDVVPLLGQELARAARPTFIYWMTLSTHVPIAAREGTPRLGCETGGPMRHVEVCHMSEMWLDLYEALATLATATPPTEVLVVGDHAPPLWSKAGRRLFVPGKVPWIRLSPR